MAIRTLLFATVLCGLASAQDPTPAKPPAQYEMTTYVLGLLRKGPNWGAGTKEEGERIQEGHMANIRRMAESGRLIVAGPLTDNGDIRGIFIFRAKSPEEVRDLAEQDPAIKAGRLLLELHPWFAAEGLRVNDPKPVH